MSVQMREELDMNKKSMALGDKKKYTNVARSYYSIMSKKRDQGTENQKKVPCVCVWMRMYEEHDICTLNEIKNKTSQCEQRRQIHDLRQSAARS
jgi:hypothetical protein